MTESLEGLARDLIADLHRAANPARAAHGAGYHPTALTLCGASMPALRSTLRAHRPALNALPARSRADLAVLLVHSGLFEAAVLAHILLDGDRPALSALTSTDLDRGPAGLGAHVDNWVLTDTFGPLVLGACWRMNVVGDAFIARWLDDPDPWYRRLTLTATIALNTRARGGTGDSARTRWVCEAALDDRAPMMVKALSWALREWAGPDPAAVSDFCTVHDARLPALVRREVRTRLETGTKRGRR